jgi:hypothetical protein
MNKRQFIISEFQRVTKSAALRRGMLREKGQSLAKLKKIFTITSGALALLSAFAITTVLIKLFGSVTFQIIAAIAAFTSGVIQLWVASNRDEEINEILKGSSRYLIIQDRGSRIPLRSNMSDDQLWEEVDKLFEEYASLDEKYLKYFGDDVKFESITTKPMDFNGDSEKTITQNPGKKEALKKVSKKTLQEKQQFEQQQQQRQQERQQFQQQQQEQEFWEELKKSEANSK